MTSLFLAFLMWFQSRPRISGGITWGIALTIAFLSLTPLSQLPPVPGSDKTHHLIAYAALAFPNALARPQKIIFFALVYVCFGGVIELVQPFANRYASWLDFAANLGGVLIGTYGGVFVNKYLNRKKTAA